MKHLLLSLLFCTACDDNINDSYIAGHGCFVPMVPQDMEDLDAEERYIDQLNECIHKHYQHNSYNGN